ncbi:MAG: bifunctional diaminohydroxyphosphoribosylaminopyrimidine deaminase/5-amino-6-(5-phosphoribosylamino)uracil reductase RibD [Chloroflexi bacterium]|jgi:diaminohydroxyphosphoribosylaminopyrimidine deaminase / 5-amino-6-(5-phosphoribosylamino)uracil reductase|nr:bifunctional diaminohydroxyphosphoribosylaminopyrimidine deaminase/5-amino-6-(5-phosphoribosylamino)uracil reductase RibD [Chloroflexota bacterium]MBT7081244.1 bifunctional diaminohydroxyphosphoribosylaminopyrimidine deaminase/5-amino-6-(5-phosphoribosylamino)uracil reductase RibD [Chloroflexota bacterium]MBT7288921.1 bifunctional diaminohydroxyphosphoribosylaminopyrimidine deaminase/5-amino-6-(5-phosphoribosylamino)uracil reductase RibD [Chloroflexota bacterium]
MDYMAQALKQAKQALGTVSPNPAVGAIIVKDNQIVGEGYTQPPGQDHAEKVALKAAGTNANGAIMYVTLEPCCHHGKTPPCTTDIIAAGIAEVHIATPDPNLLVAGKGVAALEAAGIKTYMAGSEHEAIHLIEAYIKFITTKRPFITAKYAMSLDGKIATETGDSKWISNEASRDHVQQMRYEADAVMVGVGTVLTDNPRLSVRIGDDDIRALKTKIIVDTKGKTPINAQLFKEPGKVLIATTDLIEAAREKQYEQLGAEVLKLTQTDGLVDLDGLMSALGERDITSVIAEGGGIILGSLFDRGLVDKVAAFIAPKIVGGDKSPAPVLGDGVLAMEKALKLHDISVTPFDGDVLITGYVKD